MSGTFEAFLSSVAPGEASDSGAGEAMPNLTLDACLAALRDQARRIVEPCPFKVGDLITVRTGADVKGAGSPHIVVELLAEPVTDMRAEAGSNQFLRQYTMRVCHFHGDSMTVHAVDHACFEQWSDVHAAAWHARRDEAHKKKGPNKVDPETPLTDVVRLLRGEGRKIAEAKITWKKGDLVEVIGYETSHAAKPMQFEGRAVGFVVTVDHSDDTTKVVYFDEDGDRRSQWFKPVDLKNFAAVESV